MIHVEVLQFEDAGGTKKKNKTNKRQTEGENSGNKTKNLHGSKREGESPKSKGGQDPIKRRLLDKGQGGTRTGENKGQLTLGERRQPPASTAHLLHEEGLAELDGAHRHVQRHGDEVPQQQEEVEELNHRVLSGTPEHEEEEEKEEEGEQAG